MSRRKSSNFRSTSDLSAAKGCENVLLKLPHKRSNEELSQIESFFRSTPGLRELCDGIPNLAVEELCRFVKIEDFAPGEPIFREGDSGDRLYFLLGGSAVEYKSIESQQNAVNTNPKANVSLAVNAWESVPRF